MMINKRGFTLVEMVITMMVASLLTISITEIARISQKASRSNNVNADFAAAVAPIEAVIKNPTMCTVNLGGMTIITGASTPISTINSRQGTGGTVTIYSSATDSGRDWDGFYINTMAIENVADLGATGQRRADLVIRGQRGKRVGPQHADAAQSGSQVITKTVPIMLYGANGNVVDRCGMREAQSEAEACRNMGGSWDDNTNGPCIFDMQNVKITGVPDTFNPVGDLIEHKTLVSTLCDTSPRFCPQKHLLRTGAHSEYQCKRYNGKVQSAGGERVCQMASAPAGWQPYGNWGTTKKTQIRIDRCISGVHKATDEFGCWIHPNNGHFGSNNLDVDTDDYNVAEFKNVRESCQVQEYKKKTVGCHNVTATKYINFATRGMY